MINKFQFSKFNFQKSVWQSLVFLLFGHSGLFFCNLSFDIYLIL
mgnify:CR=1 FL=1